MGAYVSKTDCQRNYNITIECHNQADKTTPWDHIGKLEPGDFDTDPDVAGIGIVGSFVGVASFALACSFLSVMSQYSGEKQTAKTQTRWFLEYLENIVQICSDMQIFTGAAYALTLRYSKGCEVSAYHYDIIASMMVITCASHLMSVTIIRNYWKYPWLSGLRVGCVTGVFLLTGLLMANQDAHNSINFPTAVPDADTSDSLLFLPAACFQDNSTGLARILSSSTENADKLGHVLQTSNPGNHVQGWNLYLVLLIFYIAALLVEAIRFCRRGQNRPGWRNKLGLWLSQRFGFTPWMRTIIETLFCIYLLGGLGIGAATVILSARYIFALRHWVDHSRWIKLESGLNPENDGTSFGQLVPILMNGLVLFGFLERFSEYWTERNNKKHEDTQAEQLPVVNFLEPSTYNLGASDKPTGTGQSHASTVHSPGASYNDPWPMASPTSTVEGEGYGWPQVVPTNTSGTLNISNTPPTGHSATSTAAAAGLVDMSAPLASDSAPDTSSPASPVQTPGTAPAQSISIGAHSHSISPVSSMERGYRR
ncbi:hypothetical protein F4778DRAFT_801643 [Xylariomycetidae sp. FL2044]|nr:hypothetical protein F4778DRAFT_801643 [Xylariomycetidae sp. FL2044]